MPQRDQIQFEKAMHRDKPILEPPLSVPFAPPFIFDCRFYGATYCRVEAEYKRLLYDIKAWVENGRTGSVDLSVMDVLPTIPMQLLWAQFTAATTAKDAAFALFHMRKPVSEAVRSALNRGDDVERRRMGIGDQCVLISVLQRVAEIVGSINVAVVYDPEYPASTELFRLSGLHCKGIAPDDPIPRDIGGWIKDIDPTIVALRRHVLENPVTRDDTCWFGEVCGSPHAQVLFWLGWQHRVPWQPIALRLDDLDLASDALVSADAPPFITCQPLELTRENKLATPAVFAREIACARAKVAVQYALPDRGVVSVVYGCGQGEIARLHTFLDQMGDLGPHEIISAGLAAWVGVIGRAAWHIAGNSAGMWLAMATSTPTTYITIADATMHGSMWDVKPSWFEPGKFKGKIVCS